jgi:hypothetical protein
MEKQKPNTITIEQNDSGNEGFLENNANRLEMLFLIGGVLVCIASYVGVFLSKEISWIWLSSISEQIQPASVVAGVFFSVLNLRSWKLLVGMQINTKIQQRMPIIKICGIISLKMFLLLLVVLILSIFDKKVVVSFLIGIIGYLFVGILLLGLFYSGTGRARS